MDNVLEFYLKMKDMMSGGLIKVAQTAKESLGAVKTYTINLVKGSEEAGQSFDKLADKVKDTRKEVDKLKETGGGLKAALMGGLMALGLGGVVQQSLAQAAMKENQQIAFKVLTGSQAFGSQLYDSITKMADTTPFESQDLARGAKTMLGYGVDKNKIMPNLNMLGNVASAQDNPAEALQSLSLAYGQVAAKGHLAGQEVLQMVNAGFNPLKEISDMTGKSMTELDKIMEKGGITIAMVDKAFQHATGEGGKFHDMMLLQSQTLGGQWSTFMDLVHSKMRAFGEFLAPAAKGLMQFAGAILNSGPAMIALGVAITSVAIAAFSAVPAITAFTAAFLASPFAIVAAISAIAAAIIGAANVADDLNHSFVKAHQSGVMLEQVRKQATANSAEQIAKARLEFDLMKDTNLQQKERIDHYKSFISLVGDYGKGLSFQNAQLAQGQKAMDDFSNAMIRNATANAIVQAMTQTNVDLYKQIGNNAILASKLNSGQEVGSDEMSMEDQHKYLYKSVTRGSNSNAYGGGAYTTYEKLKGADLAAGIAAYVKDKDQQLMSVAKTATEAVAKYGKQQGLSLQTAVGAPTGGKDVELGDAPAKGIASGGPRVINISGVKFMDKLADHVNINNQGDMANIEAQFQELFLRVLNSGASVQ